MADQQQYFLIGSEYYESFKRYQPLAQKEEPVSEEHSVGQGIKDAMAALGDKPASDEIWVGHLGAYAEGEKNSYHYNKERGQVYVSFPTTAQG